MATIAEQVKEINDTVSKVNSQTTTGAQKLTPLSTKSLASQTPVNLPESPVEVEADAAMEQFGSMAEQQSKQFQSDLDFERDQAKTQKDMSFDALLSDLNDSEGANETIFNANKEFGVEDKRTELNRLNNEILQEQVRARRKIQAIDEQGGGLKIGAEAEKRNVARDSAALQADLSIVQMAAQGAFESAQRLANQKASILFERQEKRLQMRRDIFENNKEAFSAADQKAFQVRQAGLERQLKNEREDELALQAAKIEAMKMAQTNGAPVSVLTAIQTAKNPEEVYQNGGRYASVDLLERAVMNAQLAKLNERPEIVRPTQVIDQGGRKLLVDTQSGEVIKDFGVTDVGVGELQKAVQVQKISTIDALRAHKGMNTTVGPNALARGFHIDAIGDNFSGSKQDFIAGVDMLTKDLTLETLIKAKENGATFGALSEGEMRLLSDSASKINTWRREKDGNTTHYAASEKDFMAELDRISSFAKLDAYLNGADPASIGLSVTPDGKVWAKNGDGSLTPIR